MLLVGIDIVRPLAQLFVLALQVLHLLLQRLVFGVKFLWRRHLHMVRRGSSTIPDGMRHICRTTLVIAVCLVAACRSNDPLRVNSIQLGRGLNPDNTVSGHTTRFKPNDTIYVSVLTDNAGSGTFTARWTFAGRPVSEPSKEVSYRGAAATEFHIQNSGGFPAGDYRVEILLDGTSIGTRTFRVDK
jgi:hypothetical protein